MRESPRMEVRVRPRHTTILAQERDALGNLLCIYRRHGLYHVGMLLARGPYVPLIHSLYVTYAGAYERRQRELSRRQRAAEVRKSESNEHSPKTS
jgi:hypothetical protein